MIAVLKGPYSSSRVINTDIHVILNSNFIVIKEILGNFTTKQAVFLCFDDKSDHMDAKDHFIDHINWDVCEVLQTITKVEKIEPLHQNRKSAKSIPRWTCKLKNQETKDDKDHTENYVQLV